MESKSRLLVGSSDSCDIVLNQPTVSKQHCELRWLGNAWEIEDLDSTNGTFVDGKRITQPQRLNTSNKVTLGRGIELQLPLQPVSTSPVDKSLSDSDQPAQNLRNLRNLSAFYAMLAGSVVVVALWVYTLVISPSQSRSDSRVQETSDQRATEGRGLDSNTGVEATQDKNAKSVPDDTPAIATTPYWAILVQNKSEKSIRLVGTAVAIGPHRLLTLASIADAINEVKDTFPKVQLRPLGKAASSIQPTSIKLHPKYPDAVKQLKSFEADLAAKLDALDSLAEPTLDESLKWSGRLDSIMNDIAKVELACLECVETLPLFLTFVEKTKSEVSETKFKMTGFPMVIPSPSVNDNLADFFLQGDAIRHEKKQADGPIEVETSDFSDVSLVSMICTNEKSQIVGIVVNQQQNEDIGSPQVAQLVEVVEFWK